MSRTKTRADLNAPDNIANTYFSGAFGFLLAIAVAVMTGLGAVGFLVLWPVLSFTFFYSARRVSAAIDRSPKSLEILDALARSIFSGLFSFGAALFISGVMELGWGTFLVVWPVLAVLFFHSERIVSSAKSAISGKRNWKNAQKQATVI